MQQAVPMVQKMISNLVKNAPRIPLWVLTSIKDPKSKLKRKTKNVEELKRGIDTLRFGGGRDPQEAILKGGRNQEILNGTFSNPNHTVTFHYNFNQSILGNLGRIQKNCSGIDFTLDKMPDNGVILVVTNAGSHELKLEESVKEKSLKKNVKIYFAFSPFCYESCDESLPVYKRLSDGRMFNNSDFSRDSFFKTVVYTVGKYSKGKAKKHGRCSLIG